MQKKNLLIAACLTFSSVCVQAQNKKNDPPPPPPPAPEAPIAPAAAPVEAITAPLPAPPPPPLPPVPTVPPLIEEPITPVILTSNGYEVFLGNIKGKTIVFLEKDCRKQKIRLSTWNAKKKYYEKQYGQLPSLNDKQDRA